MMTIHAFLFDCFLGNQDNNKKVTMKTSTSSFAKKKPVDFDDELRVGDVRYDNMIYITFKVQLF